MKTFQILIGLSVVILLSVIATKENITFFGGSAVDSYYGSTNTSANIPTAATTTNPILSYNTARENAKVCYLSGTSTVFLHRMSSNSTTTGIAVNTGIPISTSTQGDKCESFPGFKGYLFGISASPAVVTVSSY